MPGLEQLKLTVTDGNAAARTLYERAGFRAWGTERAAIKLDGVACDKVHMAMRIESDTSSAGEAR